VFAIAVVQKAISYTCLVHVLHQAVADRFHVMVQINKELDMQRKKEKRTIEQKIKLAKITNKSLTIKIYWQA
jgi:Transposase